MGEWLTFEIVWKTVLVGMLGSFTWWQKRAIDRLITTLAITHDMVVQLKAEHDAYKDLGACPLMNSAKKEVENG